MQRSLLQLPRAIQLPGIRNYKAEEGEPLGAGKRAARPGLELQQDS